MSVLAAIRPGDVNVPLFLHVLGAMLLVGALLAVVAATAIGWGRGDGESPGLTRFALRALLLGVLPAYVLMRVGAQWTEAAVDYPEGFDPTWLGIGYVTADAGGILIIVSVVLSALGLRRIGAGGGSTLGRAVGIISAVLLVAYVVAVWAMSAKPS